MTREAHMNRPTVSHRNPAREPDPPGDALAAFPGAVARFGPGGTVLSVNRAGEAIAAVLQGTGAPALRQAIESALGGRAAQINPLLLPAGEGGRTGEQAFDVAVLPWGDGATALLLGRDISLERSLRAALIESRQRYKDLVEAACDFAWETDTDGRFTFVSPQGALGYGAAELVGTPARALQVDCEVGAESPFTARTRLREVEFWVNRRDGTAACLLVTALPLAGADGEWRGVRGLCRDVTAARSHEARLAVDRNRERLLSYILGILRDEMEPGQMLQAACAALVPALPATGACIVRRARDGAIVRAAQAGVLPSEEALEPFVRRATAGETDIEAPLGDGTLFGGGTFFDEVCNGAVFLWRAGGGGVWTGDDRVLLAEVMGQIGLTNRQLAHQEELEELSSRDPLTGLMNRRSFQGELERRYSRRDAWRGGAALFYIDMDNFKAVNDRHGHQKGDLALVTLARILREQTRSRDLSARLGGDEFALFIEDITPAAALHKGREVLKAAGELKALSGDPALPLGISIGAAFCARRDEAGIEALIERADRAMYAVKRQGKGNVELDAPSQDEDAETRS